MPVNEGTPALPSDNSARYVVGIYLPDGNFYALRGDVNKNLLVGLGAGTAHVGSVDVDKLAGVAVAAPAALGVPALPILAAGEALYLAQTITPTTTSPLFSLGSLALAGGSIFDAKTATIAVVNNSNQAIVSGILQLTDTVGGVAVSLLYQLAGTGKPLAIAASGGSATFAIPLAQGILKTVNLGVTYTTAPTSGTISCVVALQGPGGASPKPGRSGQHTTTCSTTAGLILAANPQRASVTFYNVGPGVLWLGRDAATAVNAGFPVPVGGTLVDDASGDQWYGVADVGTATAVWVETGSNWN